jgi:hypothetical protein
MLQGKLNRFLFSLLAALLILGIILVLLDLFFTYVAITNHNLDNNTMGFISGFSKGLSDVGNIVLGAIFAGIVGVGTTIFTLNIKELSEKERLTLGFYYELQEIKEFLDGFNSQSETQQNLTLLFQKDMIYSDKGLYFIFRKEMYLLDTDLFTKMLDFYSSILKIKDIQTFIKKVGTGRQGVTAPTILSINVEIQNAKNLIDPILNKLNPEKAQKQEGGSANHMYSNKILTCLIGGFGVLLTIYGIISIIFPDFFRQNIFGLIILGFGLMAIIWAGSNRLDSKVK